MNTQTAQPEHTPMTNLSYATSLRLKARARQAFTLIELLVVLALTALLLALLFAPIIQGFKLTNKARALAEAQDASRFGIERLKRELAQAAYVFDNSNTPIALPLEDPTQLRGSQYSGLYPLDQNGNATNYPYISYGKIDFIPSATRAEDPGAAIDPTTNTTIGGSPVVLPVAPGRRYVRYFIGLRQNTTGATGNKQEYYRNVYEFPRTDNDLNPFILYRVEYDPTDPNLIKAGVGAFDPGGINDPNFFYNTEIATNGRSYAQNWKNAASPVLGTTNLDVVAWRRDTGRQIVGSSPFQTTINFGPAAIAGDTATPGSVLTNIGDSPTSVPSVYTSQYGQWTYPFTVNVYRGSTRYGSTRTLGNTYGNMRFSVEQVINNGGTTSLQVRLLSSENGGEGNSLPADDNSYYWLYDTGTGKISIFTQNVAFTLDPTRGRVETAFPPLATQQSGTSYVPLYIPGPVNSTANAQALTAGLNGNYGHLIPTVYRRNTRDDDTRTQAQGGHGAGMEYGGANQNEARLHLPLNQGITQAGLADAAYYSAAPPYGNITALPASVYASPFTAFGRAGNTNAYRSVSLVPGSEQVLGPDNTLSFGPGRNDVTLFTYSRQPIAAGDVQKTFTLAGSDPTWLYQWGGPLQYQIASDLANYAAPVLIFDIRPDLTYADQASAPGLPARRAGDANQGELRVTYLWQNNYARNVNGEPVNEAGEAIGRGQSVTNGAAPTASLRPEADVIKVDYSTRQLLNLNVGARVYDTSSGLPQTASASDTVKIGNISR